MKITPVVYMLPVVAMLAASPLQAGWKGGNPVAGGQAVLPVVTPLSDVEASTLSFMREEEKFARDVYLTLFDRWESPIFENISAAEQRHMDNMKRLVDAYGLVDPVTDDTVGVFTNTSLAALYQELTEKGAISLEDALFAGALVEELDITDLKRAIAESTHAEVTKAYESLMRGSRNHLRAFVSQIESLGIVYEAQVMSQEEVDEIINSAVERGGKGRGGR
ncbi:DUF2202 domain-containing protein [Thiolapillus sp.]